MLECIGISKAYDGRQVLAGLDLSVERGEVYGLAGANGAGKTTLMNIITRIVPADAGQVLLNGSPVLRPRDIVGKVGYMLDIPALFDFMNAYELFEYLASPLRLERGELARRSEELLKLVGLADVGEKLIKSYSRGMKQRIGIAAGLVTDPEIILMDEPTSALDPQGRYDVVNIIRKMREQGRTVILSTHILSDVEKVADRIGILINGRLKVEGAVAEVITRYSRPVYDIWPKDPQKLEELWQFVSALPYPERSKKCAGYARVQIPADEEALKKLFSDVAGCGVAVRKFENYAVSLEEIFIREAENA